MKRIILDKSKCIGCFECVHICPEAFEVDNDARAKVRDYANVEAALGDIESASICCPAKAISIMDQKLNLNPNGSFLENLNSILDVITRD